MNDDLVGILAILGIITFSFGLLLFFIYATYEIGVRHELKEINSCAEISKTYSQDIALNYKVYRSCINEYWKGDGGEKNGNFIDKKVGLA